MAFSCRWAHPLKWARNQGFSLGRHNHSQAPNLPAQAELHSTTKDTFSELHRTWIWTELSPQHQGWAQKSCKFVWGGLFVYFYPSILLPGRGAELDCWRQAASCPEWWDSTRVLCLQSLGALPPLTRAVVDVPLCEAGTWPFWHAGK